MTEAQVKKEIKRRLDAAGAWYFMPVPTGYGRRGIPDFICCVKGRFLAIEAKADGKMPSKWQERELRAIEKAHGGTLVIDGDNFWVLDAVLARP